MFNLPKSIIEGRLNDLFASWDLLAYHRRIPHGVLGGANLVNPLSMRRASIA